MITNIFYKVNGNRILSRHSELKDEYIPRIGEEVELKYIEFPEDLKKRFQDTIYKVENVRVTFIISKVDTSRHITIYLLNSYR